nr:transmembrane domain containing protein [Marseillevirus futianmevirus]
MSRVNKLEKCVEPLLWTWYIPAQGSAFIIGWSEEQDKRNFGKPWYVMIPKVCWRTICWPYYIREYL